MDIVSNSRIRLFGNAPRRNCERFASLFRSTWDRLPTKDRKKMLTHCRHIKGRNVSTLLFVDYSETDELNLGDKSADPKLSAARISGVWDSM